MEIQQKQLDPDNKKSYPEKYDRELIEEIKEIANENIEIIFDKLGIEGNNYYNANNEIRCSCPVHDGDNPTAFCYNTQFNYWRCYTNYCHEGNHDIIGLVKLIKQKNIPEFSFINAIDWTCDLLSINRVKSSNKNEDFYKISKIVSELKIKDNFRNNEFEVAKNEFPIPISKINTDNLNSPYFQEQGFAKDIIKKFYIGECYDKRKPMYNRAFGLILDDNGQNIVGVSGRTLFDKCEICSYYHETNYGCPTDNLNVRVHAKWKHYGFNSGSTLYNINNAHSFIRSSKTVVITEGIKDVWWLDQHGIYNSLSVFGINITSNQLRKILSFGCTNLVLGFDNDERGLEATDRVIKNIGHIFKIYKIQNFMENDKDIADISTENMIKLSKFINNI